MCNVINMVDSCQLILTQLKSMSKVECFFTTCVMNDSFSSLLLNPDLLLSLFSTLLLLYLFFTLLLLSRFFQITYFFSLLQDMDSTNPYSHQNSSFVDLLSSQQEPFRYEGLSQLPIFNSQCTVTSSFGEDTPTERRERKK